MWSQKNIKRYKGTAKGIFKDTNLNITNSYNLVKDTLEEVGTVEFRKQHEIMRVNEWVTELKLLIKIAKFYPQARYCAFTSGFRETFN